jgi:hypothetical protein
MFRALKCSSSGGQFVLSQHMLSSHSVNGCAVCRMRADSAESAFIRHNLLYCTAQRVTIPDAVIIQFVLLKMGILMLETCRGL